MEYNRNNVHMQHIPTMPANYPPPSAHTYHARDDRRRPHSRSRDRNARRSRHGEYKTTHHRRTTWHRLREHLVAMVSEFIGTIMFLWFAFAGTQVAAQTASTGSDTQQILFISLSFGLSLMVTAWAHYRISGGLFNPAVTLALCMTENLPWIRGLFLLPAQMLGGIVAAALVSCMLPGDLAVVTRLSAGTSIAQGVFIEAFGTMLLVFVIIMLAAEKHAATPLAPVGIGMALFVGEIGCVYYTGGALNPARAFGPSVVARDFPGYHYLYWFGPVIGALMASFYYGFCKYNNYEDVNPGQDSRGQ